MDLQDLPAHVFKKWLLEVHSRIIGVYLREKTFRILPALSIRRKNLRDALRTVTLAWTFGVVWMACISGSQITLFGRLLGFSNFDFGLLAALPWLAVFAQAFSAVAIERSGLRKYPVIIYGAIHRSLWLVIAIIPLILGPGRPAIIAFFIVYSISYILAHMRTPGWFTWMGDLIPRRIRGRYFAMRALLTMPVRLIVYTGAGILLDIMTNPDAPMTIEYQPRLLWTICGLFTIAAIFGTIDTLLYLRIREIATPALVNKSYRHHPLLKRIASDMKEALTLIISSFKDRLFRYYAIYSAILFFSMTVSGQFGWLNALEVIGFSKVGANIVFLVCPFVAAAILIRKWGRFMDRWGRRTILLLCTIGVILPPLTWFFIPPGQATLGYILLGISSSLGGILWWGINIGQTGILLGFSESAGRSKYAAAAAICTSLGAALGGLTGGYIAQSLAFLQQHPIHVGPFQWNNYHATFAIAILARIIALPWIIHMPDPGVRPFREFVKEVRYSVYNILAIRSFFPIRLLRRRAQKRKNDNPQQ